MNFLKKQMTRTLLMTAVLAASSQLFAALPDVLEKIPDNADAVIVLKDLKAVSTKIANTATRLNLPVPPDPIGIFAQRIGITRGLDQNGSLALYVAVPETAAPEAGPPIVLLIPTTDSKALLEGLNPSSPENGISTVTLPNDAADTGYVATIGNYVALAQNKDLLTQFLSNKTSIQSKLSASVKTAFENNDLVVFANVPHFRDRVIKSIQAFKPMIGMMMAMQAQGDPASTAMVSDMMTGMITGMEQIITDGDAAVETVRITDAGITLGFGAVLKPGTPSGNFIAAQKPLVSPALTGLPNGKYILAGTGVWDPVTMGKLVGFFGDLIVKNPSLANSPKLEAVKKNIEMQKQSIEMTTGARFALYEQEGASNGPFSVVINADVTDSGKYKKLVRANVDNSIAATEAMQQGIAVSLVKKEETFSVRGVVVDEYDLKYAAKEPLPAGVSPEQSKMQIEAIEKMWGHNGLSVHVGYFDNTVVQVLNGDQKLAEAAVTASKDKTDEIGMQSDIVTANKQAVPNAIGIVYVPVDRIITMAKRIAEKADAPVAGGVTLGGSTQPIVISTGVDQSVLTSEIHVPISALGLIIQTAQGQ